MPEEPGEARELDRFWNDLVAGRGDAQGYAIPPDRLETVRAFQKMANSAPPPSSRERVDSDVFAAIEHAAAGRQGPPLIEHRITAHPDSVFGRNGSHYPGNWQTALGRRNAGWNLSLIVPLVVSLLLLAFVGSLVTMGTLHWPHDEAPPANLSSRFGSFELLWESNGGPEPLASPYGLGIAPDGTVWVSDGRKDRFQLLNPDGAFIENWGISGSGEGEFEFYSSGPGFSNNWGDVAFDAAGNIFVADTGNFRIQKFSPDRTFLLSWGGKGTAKGQFLVPGSIAVDGDGMVYVADEERHDIQKFDGNGKWLTTIGGKGTDHGQLRTPTGVTADTAGDIWVVDFGNDRIQRFSSLGESLTVWGRNGRGTGELRNPSDVAVDAQGRVFVADDGNSRIQVFAADGRFLAEVGSSIPGTVVSYARTVAVNGEGIVFVTSGQSVRAYRLLLPTESELIS